MATPVRSVTPDANAHNTTAATSTSPIYPSPIRRQNNTPMPFLIAAAGALTNGRPTLARAEVVFVLRIETYDPTSDGTQPADALRCFPTAPNQMAAISSCNMTCWQGASSAYGCGEAKNKNISSCLPPLWVQFSRENVFSVHNCYTMSFLFFLKLQVMLLPNCFFGPFASKVS